MPDTPSGANRKWTIRLEWKLADCWIGAFWQRGSFDQPGFKSGHTLDIWVCLLPMFPIHARRVVWWETCYGCGEPIADREFERHGRAGACHVEHAGW